MARSTVGRPEVGKRKDARRAVREISRPAPATPAAYVHHPMCSGGLATCRPRERAAGRALTRAHPVGGQRRRASVALHESRYQGCSAEEAIAIGANPFTA